MAVIHDVIPAFELFQPTSVDDALALQSRHGAKAWVLAGGLFAAFLGPQLVILTKDLMPPYLFAASYLGQAATAVCAILALSLVRARGYVARPGPGRARALSEIARQPRFIVAATCGVASYSLMNLMMTAAPLAMVDCGHSVGNVAIGLTGMGNRPLRASGVEQALRGKGAHDDDLRTAAERAAEGTDPPQDLNGSPDYRRHLAQVLTRRALEDVTAHH